MDVALFCKAVEDSEQPTPGYLYNTLTQWTFADSTTLNQLLSALFDKLSPAGAGQPASARVVYKSLHLVRVLCVSGHEEFQRQAQTTARSAVLRSYTAYHGPTDELSATVRAEAAAALQAAFDASRGGSGPSSPGASGAHRGGGGGRSDFSGAGAVGAGANGTGSSFVTGTRTGGAAPWASSAAAAGAGAGADAGNQYASSGGNVAEMPADNKWMEYVAQRDRERAAEPRGTLLQQLSDKAKAGWELIREFEGMRVKEDRIYDPSLPRDSAARGDDTHWLPSRGAHAADARPSNYCPVGVPGAENLYAETVRGESAEREASREGVGLACSRTTSGSTGAPAAPSRFAFVNAPSDASPDAAPSPFLRRVVRLASAKAIPQRVELADFVAFCIAEGERTAQQQSSSGSPGAAAPSTAFGFLDECTAPPRTAPADPWAPLGPTLDEQLSPQLPWQHRLNSLYCLEALLLRSSSSSSSEATTATAQTPAEVACRAAVRDYLRAHATNVQRNTHVAQSSLREKATRVMALLGLSTAAPTAGSAQALSSSPAPVGRPAAELSLDGLTVHKRPSASSAQVDPPPPSSSQQQQQQQQWVPASTAGGGLFAADDGTALRLRRRAPRAGGSEEKAAAAVPAGAASRGESRPSNALDSLFSAAGASPPVGGQPPRSGSHMDDLFGPSAAPAAQAKPSITVLAVHDSHGAALAGVDAQEGMFNSMEHRQPPWTSHVGHSGGAEVVPSNQFSMGAVSSAAPAAGSVQSMNQAFAEMQRRAMANPSADKGS